MPEAYINWFDWLAKVKVVALTHRSKQTFKDPGLISDLYVAFEFGMSPGEACACIAEEVS